MLLSDASLKKRLNRLTHMNRLSWILWLTSSLLLLFCLYYFSAYWASRQVLNALKTQNMMLLKQKIPSKLLTHLLPNTHPEKKWQGAGSEYLKHVWPKLYQEMDREAWLSLRVQKINDHEISHHYQHYFNQYALDLGSSDDQIRIEFERTGLIHWRVKQVCYPDPQPDTIENGCLSSNR